MQRFVLSLFLAAVPLSGHSQVLTLQPMAIIEWKAVFGQIAARDQIPARARLGGTVVALNVSAGDMVTAGQVLAQVQDDKLAFQLSAQDAQLASAQAQLVNAQAEVDRGQSLLSQGVTTVQHLDQLRTQVDVLSGQISALTAQRKVIEEQVAEGAVLAPLAGRVLQVPATKGAVIMPGEVVATLAGGGIYLRLSVPERHARELHTGDAIQIDGPTGEITGKLVKIYPLIESGRVVADVEVPGMAEDFIAARVLVRLPVATRQALMVPAAAVTTRSGLDFVTLAVGGARVVVPGQHQMIKGVDMVEVISGLMAGDTVVAGSGQ